MPELQGEAANAYLHQQGLSASLEGAVLEALYAVRPGEGESAYWAQNPAQGMRAGFSPQGLTLNGLGYGGGRSWETVWTLRSVGYGDSQLPVSEGEVSSLGTRAEIRRRSAKQVGIVEWYENRPAGLKQGFRVSAPPPSAAAGEPLRLVMELGGDLTARAAADGQALELLQADGALVMRYDQLKVEDATGKLLTARMGGSGRTAFIEVEDRGAVWPVTIDPTFVQQAYLKASNTDILQNFGYSVAVSGDTVVVGSRAEVAYVFVRTSGVWSEQAFLKASNIEAGDQFGHSVAVSGETIVVGAFGEDSDASQVDGDQGDNSASNSGAAYVFVRSGGTWSQQAYLKASNAEGVGGSDFGDRFGISVAISGDTVVVGALGESSKATGVNGNQNDNSAPDSGAAYVFVRSGQTWSQQAYLKASDTEGKGFAGKQGQDHFASVAISGDTVVVGAPGEDSSATGVNGDPSDNSASDSGAAYVFVRNGQTWSQQAYLKPSNTEILDPWGFGARFGGSVAVSGNTVIVGAQGEDSSATGVDRDQGDEPADSAGAAYVFARLDGTWSQQAYLKASNTQEFDGFGGSVAISGDKAIVGALGEDGGGPGADADQSDNSSVDAGAAYLFIRNGGTWSQQGYLKASNPDATDFFGFSVAVSEDTLVVGAFEEDGDATGVNGDQSDNSKFQAGAAYVFVSNSPSIVGMTPPANGDAPGQLYSFTFSDPDGATDLDVVNILVNNFLDGRQACYLAYVQTTGWLFLVNDAGDAIDGLPMGIDRTLSNSQCTVDLGASSVTRSGDTLRLDLSLAFHQKSFAGNKIFYLAARDRLAGNSGWVVKGVVEVPPVGSPSTPRAVRVSPSSGSGSRETFRITYRDSASSANLAVTQVLINRALDGRGACYLGYDHVNNLLYLVDDAGSPVLLGPIVPGNGVGTLENSQCKVHGAGTSVSEAATDLTLTLALEFKPSFVGPRVVLTGVQTRTGESSGWQAMGVWQAQ